RRPREIRIRGAGPDCDAIQEPGQPRESDDEGYPQEVHEYPRWEQVSPPQIRYSLDRDDETEEEMREHSEYSRYSIPCPGSPRWTLPQPDEEQMAEYGEEEEHRIHPRFRPIPVEERRQRGHESREIRRSPAIRGISKKEHG